MARSRLSKFGAAVFAIAILLSAHRGVGAEALGEVDVALVIAVDISYSMDLDEQRLQREGYAEALRSRLVLEAVNRGAIGRIAVTYMEWASWNDQRVVVPWQIIEGPRNGRCLCSKA